MELKIASVEAIDEAARRFVELMAGYRLFAFYGGMGVGKTTFIKAICAALGVRDIVTSPTFAIVNEYADGEGKPVYHFDFYRLRRAEEAFDIGLDDYLSSGCVCLMEWPEMVEALLPDEVVRVQMEELESGERRVKVNA